MGLAFETVNSGVVLKAPKKKLPYLDDDGTVVADTHFIIEYPKARCSDPLDGALTPAEHAMATALLRLIEQNL